MVSFQTAEVYNEDQNNIIGVKVIVSADNGQVIDEIQVTNKTDFEELEARLNSLGDDYVQFADESQMSGETIDSILENVSEVFEINATTLGGFQSDDYAKTVHTHQKSNITNLYNYDISSSNYNLKLNGSNEEKTATISVKVTNMSNSPVGEHNVIIYKNNAAWVTGTTNAQGVFSSTFTADSPGIVTFQVNNQKVQCHVVDTWKVVSTAVGILRVNEELRLVNFHGTKNMLMSNKNTEYLITSIPSQYAPLGVIRQVAHGDIDEKITIAKLNIDGNLHALCSSNHSSAIGVSWNFTWMY